MTKQFSTPGPRAIHPELCTSPSLARCGIVANALFPRLIAIADDQGRIKGDAGDVLGRTFPGMLSRVLLADIEEALDELHEVRAIHVYGVRGDRYIQLLGWWDWQSMRRAYPSRYPAHTARWVDRIYGVPGSPGTLQDWENRNSTGDPRSEPAAKPGSNAANRRKTGGNAASRDPVRAGPRSPARGNSPARPGHARPSLAGGGGRSADDGLKTGDDEAAPPPGRTAQQILDDPESSDAAKEGARQWIALRSSLGGASNGRRSQEGDPDLDAGMQLIAEALGRG